MEEAVTEKRHVVVRLKGFPRFWTAVAAVGAMYVAHVWGNEQKAALFADAMDATMVARLVRRDGIECEVLPAGAIQDEVLL